MTVNWMDLSVEHLSKYIKHFGREGPTVQQRLTEILMSYLDNAQAVDLSSFSSALELAVHNTLVLIPLKANKLKQDNNLSQLQLAATLASLWRFGMGRAVVVGVSDLEREIAEGAFGLLRERLSVHSMELAYVEYTNNDTPTKNVPRLALKGLQFVMNPSNIDNAQTQEWLGPNPDHWKYVYYTEPDLLLQTRPSAMPAITEALSQGVLMTAHRLEPIPHQRDFPFMNKRDNAATGQLLQTLTGHMDNVNSVAWSPGGTTLASGSSDNTVKIWNATTGQLLRTLTGHNADVWSVAWSPDGTTLASGGWDDTVQIWNADTGQAMQNLTGHTTDIWSVAWNPRNATELASGSSDHTVEIRNVNTGQLVQTLRGHTWWVHSVAWNLDGTKLASGSDDDTVRIWDAALLLQGHGS